MILSAAMEKLIQKAFEARKHSYSPYSKFAVGAALEAEDGTIFVGTNVENASYGLTTCAEQVALCAAVAQGYRKFKRIAVVTDTPHPTPPCGLCRQALSEFSPKLEVILANTEGKTEVITMDQLLPKAFRL